MVACILTHKPLDKLLFCVSFWTVELTYRWCYPGKPTEERVVGYKKANVKHEKERANGMEGQGAIC